MRSTRVEPVLLSCLQCLLFSAKVNHLNRWTIFAPEETRQVWNRNELSPCEHVMHDAAQPLPKRLVQKRIISAVSVNTTSAHRRPLFLDCRRRRARSLHWIIKIKFQKWYKNTTATPPPTSSIQRLMYASWPAVTTELKMTIGHIISVQRMSTLTVNS